MRLIRQGLTAAIVLGMAAVALGGDVVVLKGGSVIALKQPWVRRGNTAYLTKADGTLLSVPVSEIDVQATASAARPKEPAPAPAAAPDATTPADAARVKREAPKAKVRITDADVSHPMDLSTPGDADSPKKDAQLATGPAKVEVAQYDQETKNGNLFLKGEIRNPTQTMAENVKLQISAIDDKGEAIDSKVASLAKGEVESGETVAFNVSLTVGDKVPSRIRFAPSWSAPRPPPPTPREGRAAADSKTRRS